MLQPEKENPFTNPTVFSTMMLAVVHGCDTQFDHDSFKPKDIPRLYMESLQVVHNQAGSDKLDRHEKHKLALQLVSSSLRMGVYKFSEDERQMVDWIMKDILPQLATIVMDILDGKYNLQLNTCKECCAKNCCVML